MGNQLASRLHVDFISELPKVGTNGEGIVFGRVLGGGRFLKTLQCWHEGKMVVVKAYSKRDVTQSLREYAERLGDIRERLRVIEHPNVLPYTWVVETQRAAFLVRAYVHMSLRERMKARPFLTGVEKQWLAYQLLTALEQCEAAGLVHGDVKANNVLVTSWNWLCLSDTSNLKPSYIPEDNPADLSFFFDDDYHRRCYVAPERFYNSSTTEARERPSRELTPAVDIFSAGCVIAELFLDGDAVFALSDLGAYRRQQYHPGDKLAGISDPSVRDMATCMISLQPELRQSAAFHLRAWQGSVFPQYFASFLHAFMWRCVGTSTPDECITTIFASKTRILSQLGYSEEEGGCCPGLVNVMVMVTACMRSVQSPVSKVQAVRLIGWGASILDDHLRMHRLLPYLCALISDDHESSSVRAASITEVAELLERVKTFPISERQVFLQYLLPVLSSAAVEADEHVCVAYAAHLGSLAQTALRFLEEAHSLAHEQQREREETRPKSLDQREGTPGATPNAGAPEVGYDSELGALQEAFISLASDFLSSGSGVVKRMVLTDMLPLCVLLGGEKTDNSLLPLIITVLNDRSDWELRAAFFDNLAGVATFVGRDSLQHFILPCIIQALTDLHELVVEAATTALAALVSLSLLPSDAAIRAAQGCLPLLLHPSGALRLSVVAFLSSLADFLGLADAYCFLRPLLKPYLRHDVSDFTPEVLLDSLKTALPRGVFKGAIQRACLCLESGNAPSLDRLRSRESLEGGGRGKASEWEDGGGDQLALLHSHIIAVAQAQMAQTMSDAQMMQDHDQEQEARASEEWLQEEWDAFFGAGAAGEMPKEPVRGTPSVSAQRPASRGAVGTGTSPRGPGGSLEEGGDVRDAAAEGRAVEAVSSLKLGDVEPQAARWISTVEGWTRDASGARIPSAEWRPRGVLVSNLAEHKHPVTCLCVPDDHTFFASGADDGTVKIWDAAGLNARETEVGSRLTMRAMPGRITALAMCQASTSLAAAQDSGVVTIVRIDAPLSLAAQNQATQWPQRSFSGTTTLRTLDYSAEKGVQALTHFNKGNSSLLMVATQRGSIHAIDLAKKDTAFTLNVPPVCGVPLCMAAGNDHNWMVVGTSRGFHILYDLRFQLDVQCWRHPGATEVYDMQLCNAHGLEQALGGGSRSSQGPWVASSAGRNQMSVWDVSRGVCLVHLAATSRTHVADMSNIEVRSQAGEEQGPADLGLKELEALSISEDAIRTILPAPDCSFIISGGLDRKVRLWDVMRPDRSVSLGEVLPEGEACVYTTQVVKGSSHSVHNILERRIPASARASAASARASPDDQMAPSGARGFLPSAPDLHSDAVTHLKMLRSPFGSRLLSASRDGVIKVWC